MHRGMRLVLHTRAAPQKEISGTSPAVDGQDPRSPWKHQRWDEHRTHPITGRKTGLPSPNPPLTARPGGPQMCGAPQRLHPPRWTGGTGTHPGAVPGSLELLFPFPALNQERDQLASRCPLLHAHLCSAPPRAAWSCSAFATNSLPQQDISLWVLPAPSTRWLLCLPWGFFSFFPFHPVAF